VLFHEVSFRERVSGDVTLFEQRAPGAAMTEWYGTHSFITSQLPEKRHEFKYLRGLTA
jgi:hypothetical protein